MKQVVLRGGAPTVADVPAPSPAPGHVLVANAASLISSGTERAGVSASGGGGSLPMRAIRNPQLVMLTLNYAREHGVRDTVDAVRNAVSDDTVLGYSSAGVVLHTGGIAEFRVGQHVACAGAGRANHAEVVSVPGNLVAPVPDGVPLRDAAFTTVGAIAMQGVRRAEAQLGERVVVVGLGLIGLLTTQLLRAAGCQVLGVEPSPERRALGAELGAELVVGPDEAAAAVKHWSGGVGADATLITASSASDAIVNQAIGLLRRKGRVVVVGDVGLGLERGPIYQREADFLISTSYGPGRYDPTYEEGGLDYPIAYVRWTENRNMEEFLRLLATGDVQVEPLIELELTADRAAEAYARVTGDTPPLAAVLTYDPERAAAGVAEVVRVSSKRGTAKGDVTVGLIGPGSFVRSVHLPNLRADDGVRIKTVVARRSTSATDIVRSLRITGEAATDWRVAAEDPELDLVVIGTRHDSHAEIAAAALRAGRAVFVEKPLGLTRDEIDDVWAAGRDNDRLAIGFNRPFAPLAQRLRGEFDAVDGPAHVVYRVNAPLAADHWLNDPRVGGGRILGEACHMIDFANWLCGTPLRVLAAALPAPPTVGSVESASITIEYANGSVATVLYSGVGAGSMPKERVEVLRGGRSWVLDDFRALTSWDPGGESTEEARGQDKGHAELMRRVLAACRGRQPFEPGLLAAYAAQSVALAAL
ncbi:MAG TPA: bi-domain-containing oxidoreductase, partial [Solirubrobacteraceae bacterium]|nr:bi-domain-containing oxidoreductase [Solirubrobacteraceae bacterium]